MEEKNQQFSLKILCYTLIITIFICCTLCFVFRFETINAPTYTLIINKLTGDKEIVNSSGELILVDASGTYKGPKFKEINVESEKMKVECNIKWRDGKLYYFAQVLMQKNKYNEVKNNISSNISICLQDEDNYLIKEIEIPLNRFAKAVGDGSTAELSINSYTPIKLSDFKAIENWDITWRL